MNEDQIDKVIEALFKIGNALQNLGVGTSHGPGALEVVADSLCKGAFSEGESVAGAIDGVAEALGRSADAIEGVAGALGRIADALEKTA